MFLFYENWRSRKDLDEHLKMPYLVEFFGKREQLVEGDIPLHFYTMLSERPR
jgi:quinol monooxygenase YgiN